MISSDRTQPLPGFDALDPADFPQPAAPATLPSPPPPALPSQLTIDRPIVFFDIEATGLDVNTDRIISLSLVRYDPPSSNLPPETRTFLVNPGRPIPPESTAIHGITDAQVRLCPPFEQVAPELATLLHNADLGGYNVGHFDIPLLTNEFRRAGIPFSADGRRIIDPQSIFFRREPRTLAAAVKFYCNEELADAHDARADIYATIRVLSGQYNHYGDLPTTTAALDDYCVQRKPDWVDRTGRLRWLNNQVVFNFGKNRGRPLREVVQAEPGFITWMLKGDFPDDLKQILRRARDQGQYPSPPTA